MKVSPPSFKIPPHNVEGEQAVIGAMFINPETGKQNSFLLGKVEPKPGKRRFFLTLPYLISSEENLSKVQEGFYEDD